MARGIQGSLGALIASAPRSKIAELERQVSMSHNMKNKNLLDCFFRDVSMLNKAESEVYSAEERDR